MKAISTTEKRRAKDSIISLRGPDTWVHTPKDFARDMELFTMGMGKSPIRVK